MNVKDRINLKQKIAQELGLDPHAPAVEVARKYMESRSWKILADDELLNNKSKALWLIVRIHQKYERADYAARG